MTTSRSSGPHKVLVAVARGAVLIASMLRGMWPSQAQAQPSPATSASPPGGDAAPAAPPETRPASGASQPAAAAAPRATAEAASPKPPPLHVEYAQYGAAIVAEISIGVTGGTCTGGPAATCPNIVGSGGGIALRGGYRAPGPWYIGGAYEFVKMDSANLYRLGIFQQLRAEMRYVPDIGYRAAPYATWGIGAVGYGNEWGVETGGGLVFGGIGVEIEVSRLAVLGVGFVYRPVLLAPWTDTAGFHRDTSLAQFFGLDFLLEVRSELGRR